MASVTVLMSVYNGMPFLPEAVESILNQTYSEWRFVIVNDGSEDGSRQYLKTLKDSRIQIIDQSNQGLAAALNHGLQYCDTPYVARMDSDDVSLPTRLELQMDYLAERPEIGMLGSQFLRMGEKRSGFASKLPSKHKAIHSALLSAKHAVCHPTIVCNTEIMKAVGGYWKHPVAQDWDLYLKMCENSVVENLNEVLLKYRIHNQSLNGKYLAKIRQNQRYAAEIARRRTDELPFIELSEFAEMEQRQKFGKRFQEKMNVFAMYHYRKALQTCLNDHSTFGYARLAFSAMCSPSLTFHRILRLLRSRQDDGLNGDHAFGSSRE